ncbi:MAG: hypothetical protein ACKOB1_02520 [Planctomycetia bacterium]
MEGRLRLLDAHARHDFPEDPAEQRTLAHLLGAAGPEALTADVQALTARIRTTFERIFDRTVAAMSRQPPGAAQPESSERRPGGPQ